MTPPEHVRTPLRVAIVANGDPGDVHTNSGVPRNIAEALDALADVEVVGAVSALPPRPLRWLVRLATVHPRRADWDARYLHGSLLARVRSRTRDVRLRRLGAEFDVVVHVRNWYLPVKATPYVAFIDATSHQLQGQSPQWTASPRTQRRRLQLETAYYAQAAAVLCAGHEAIETLTHTYGVTTPTRWVGGGVNRDLQTLADPVPSRQGLAFIGKDPERKGLPDLLTALARIRASGHDLRLSVIGPPAPPVVPDGVDWIGRVSDRRELAAHLAGAAAFCMPSHQEAFGLAVLEAMSMGLPCVVSDVGELPHLIEAGATGWVVPRGDVDALESTLRSIVEHPERLEPMGAAARAVAGTYTWRSVAERIREALDAELDRRARA